MKTENELLKEIIAHSDKEINELKKIIRELAFKHQNEEINISCKYSKLNGLEIERVLFTTTNEGQK